MIKICCDRCGTEIENKYYTIDIYEHDMNLKNNGYTADIYNGSGYSNTRVNILKMLNSQEVYCEKCKEKIQAYFRSNDFLKAQF